MGICVGPTSEQLWVHICRALSAQHRFDIGLMSPTNLNDNIFTRKHFISATIVQTRNVGTLRYANRRALTQCLHTAATQAMEYQLERNVGCRSRRCGPMPKLGQRHNAGWEAARPGERRVQASSPQGLPA